MELERSPNWQQFVRNGGFVFFFGSKREKARKKQK
jgi:hypothetical protein